MNKKAMAGGESTTTHLDTVAKRVEWARKLHNWTQKELANEIVNRLKIAVSPQAIQMIESGKTVRSRFLQDIAVVTGVREKWLTYGEGDPLHTGTVVPSRGGERVVQKAPVIPIDRLTEYKSIIGAVREGSSEFPLVHLDLLRDAGGNVFATRVPDAGMLPRIGVDDLVLIDPDMPYRPGSVVAYYRNKDGSSLIRRFRQIDENNAEMIPSNEDFPRVKLESGDFLIGPVIEIRTWGVG